MDDTTPPPPTTNHSRCIGVSPARRGGVWVAMVAASLVVTGLMSPEIAQGAERDADETNGPSIDQVGKQALETILADASFEIHDGELRVEDPAPFGPYEILGIDGSAPDFEDHGNTPDEPDDGPVAAAGSVFELHSRPNATRKIFIDFDGQTVTGTSWNTGGNPIVAGRYRRGPLDQPDVGFTASELSAVSSIWENVSEDFAPWDVDVTTQDPGDAGLTKSSGNDVRYGIRVIVTPDYQWYSSQRYGGVAYLWSFIREIDLPAWVFSSNLSNGDPKSVAEAITHEAGHSLGLRHDGVSEPGSGGSTVTSAYYAGHGSWAPIMGVGYSKPTTQWSRGEYTGANNTEDDLALIDDMLLRLDAGSTVGSGSVLGPGQVTVRDSITTGGGTDVHTLDVTSGPVSVSVRKADPDGNLLANLTIRNAAGVAVATSSPIHPSTWTLSASLPAGVAPGRYTIEVHSIGWLTPLDGFSDYASIGSYVLDVVSPGVTPPTSTPPPTPPPTSGDDPMSGGGGRLNPISPNRVLDTRSPSSAIRGPIAAGSNVTLRLPGVPAGTSAAVLNVVAVQPSSTGFLSLTPCNPVTESSRTSSVNFVRGPDIANSLIVPITANGDVCIYTSATTQVVVDVTGWIGSSGSLTLDSVTTQRVVDSRIGVGVPRRISAGTRTVIALAGRLSGVGVGAVSLNLTAVRPTSSGYLTVDDCTAATGATSSLNVTAGETRGNNGVFTLGAQQQLCVYTTTTTDITVDITGLFGAGDGLRFVAATPTRLLDTRSSAVLAAGSGTSFTVPTTPVGNGLTTAPRAASINLTAADHVSNGYVTAWDCGFRPTTSALNPVANQPTANGARRSLSDAREGCLFHASGGDLIVDLAGWWV